MVSNFGAPAEHRHIHSEPDLKATKRSALPIGGDVSRRMRAVRRSGTEAERQLERALRSLNLRFKTQLSILRCTPDIVFVAERLAIFVDGDFWHGRLLIDSGLRALEESFGLRSRQFWVAKIKRNVKRDKKQMCLMRRHGWSVLRLWARDVLMNPDASALVVAHRLRKRGLSPSRRLRDVA